MTKTAQLLARLAAGRQWDSGPGSTGSDKLTTADIAAGLAGLDRATALLLTAKYGGSLADALEAEIPLYLQVVDHANRRRWKVPKGRELLRRLTRLAIYETIHPATCPRCNGVGQRGTRSCPGCGGSGRANMNQRERARFAGVHGANWSRTWGARYEEVHRLTRSMEQAGLRHVRRKIGR